MAFSIPASRAWTRPSWRSTLSTNDKTTAEDKLRKLGYEWQWLEQDSAGVTTPVPQAIRETSSSGKVFFNQLIAAFRGWKDTLNAAEKSIGFGDDSQIRAQSMATAIALGDELSLVSIFPGRLETLPWWITSW